MPENQPTEPKPRIELLYIGCRENERGKPLCHLWYDLTNITNDGSPLKDEQARHQIYGSKKKQHSTQNLTFASPGAIYSFERSDNGVYGSTGRYLGRWTCEDDVVKWTAEHNAIDRAAELAERAKKENKQHLDWEVLAPFRRAYQGRLNYKQQQMLLAQIIQFVTKYRAEDKEQPMQTGGIRDNRQTQNCHRFGMYDPRRASCLCDERSRSNPGRDRQRHPLLSG